MLKQNCFKQEVEWCFI